MPIHHAVACPLPASGHTRPCMAFVTNVVDKYPSIVFTVITHKDYVKMSLDEIKRSAIPETASRRIRVVGVVTEDSPPGLAAIMMASADLGKALPAAYGAIVRRETVTCTATGTVFDYHDIPSPKLAFSDFMGNPIGKTMKEINPDAKLIVHWITTVGMFTRMCGPKEMGGLASWEEDAYALVKENPTKSLGEAAAEVELNKSGEKPWPNPEGMQLYEYELYPQQMPSGEIFRDYMAGINLVNVVADGAIASTTETFEPKAFQAFREWYEGPREKKIFCIGARSGFRMLESGRTPVHDPKDKETYDFLDKQAARSTWLISFGTIFFPFMNPNQLYATIKALLDSKTPFILSRQSLMSILSPGLPAELEKAIAESGLGLIAQHVPQQEVLQHPSIGAFVTHGGVNSMFELIVSGVVPVFWPFAADQPCHAAYLRHKDCAFELFQVRTGAGAQPSLLGGKIEGTDDAISAEVTRIVEDLKGDVGAQKRKNLQVVKDDFVKAMSAGGSVDVATEECLRFAFGEDL